MSRYPDIKCDICDYQFKVYSQMEEHVEDYELVEVNCYYPLPEENAHLVSNYICDKCYQRIGEIIKDNFIKSGVNYCLDLDKRKNEAKLQYEQHLQRIENYNVDVTNMVNKLRNLQNLYELSEEEIKQLKNNFPYTNKATYYLDQAIRIEKERKLGIKSFNKWCKDYKIKDYDMPSSYSRWSEVNKEQFLEILKNCEIKDGDTYLIPSYYRIQGKEVCKIGNKE